MLEELLSQALRGAMGGATGSGQAQPTGGGALINVLGSLLNSGGQGGGLAGLVEQFARAGLGQQVQSWVGTGQNMPVSQDQLSQVFGQQGMQQMAQQAGMDHNEFGGILAQVLPRMVDSLTPNGQLPQGGVSDAMGMLARMMQK